MATTPNYGWVTPAPTDFVTDLPADFEVFADAVDADLAGLLGGSTGQYLVKDSAADHDFSWQTLSISAPQPYLSNTTAGSYLKAKLGDNSLGASANATVARTCYTPIYLPSCTLDRIGVRTGGLTGNYTVRLGIYNNTNGKPSTVLLDAGTVSATAGNTNYEITINQVITEGWYWLAANAQVQVSAGTPAFISTGSGSAGQPQFFASVFGLGISDDSGYVETGITGAFATASPSSTGAALILPSVRLA